MRFKKMKLTARGMSLIEILVALGLMSVMMAAFATMMTTQQKENKYIQQLQEVMSIKTFLLQVFTKQQYCVWDLAGQTIDASSANATTPSPTVLNINNIYSGPDNTSSVIISAVVGQLTTTTSQTGLKISSIQFLNIYPTGNTDEFKGTVSVSFDPTSTVRQINALQMPFIVKALPISGTHPASARALVCSVKPGNLALNQVPNNKNFTVSWTAGISNGGAGGCKLQYQKNDNTWVDIPGAVLNCDADLASQAVTLPGDNWLGGPWTSGRTVQIVRVADNYVVAAFPSLLTCAAMAASGTPTPTIDEDCDNYWDNAVSATVWTSYSTWFGGNNCPRYGTGYYPAPGTPCTLPTPYFQNQIFYVNGAGPYAQACPGQGSSGGSVNGVTCQGGTVYK